MNVSKIFFCLIIIHAISLHGMKPALQKKDTSISLLQTILQMPKGCYKATCGIISYVNEKGCPESITNGFIVASAAYQLGREGKSSSHPTHELIPKDNKPQK